MDDKELYTIAILRYKEEQPDLKLENMFSIDWNLSKNYKLKNIIIARAIQEHKKVEETEIYKKYFSKVKNIGETDG